MANQTCDHASQQLKSAVQLSDEHHAKALSLKSGLEKVGLSWTDAIDIIKEFGPPALDWLKRLVEKVKPQPAS